MGDVGVVDLVIAVAIGVVIWRVSIGLIRMLGTPPPEVDPTDVVEVEQRYRCTICGTEVIMIEQNVQEAVAPRHCREDMVPIWVPG